MSSQSEECISCSEFFFFPELHLRVCRDPCGTVTDVLKGVFENVGMMGWCREAENDKEMGCRGQELLTSGTVCVCQAKI